MPKWTFTDPVVAQAQQTQTYLQQQVQQVQQSVDAQVDEVQLDYATLEQLSTKQDKGDYATKTDLLTKQDVGAYLDASALQPLEATLSDHETRISANATTLNGLGQLATKNTLSYSEVTGTPVLGALASKDQLQYTDLQNLPTLGWLASKNTLNYLELVNAPQLGSLAGRNSLNYNELLGAPDVSGLTTRVGTAETNIASNTSNIGAAASNLTSLSNRLSADEGTIITNSSNVLALGTRVSTAETNISTNTTAITANTSKLNTLGTLATKSTVDYTTDVINTPATLAPTPMYRNRLINGDFAIAERAQSASRATWWFDRWALVSTTQTPTSAGFPTQSRNYGTTIPGCGYYGRISTFSGQNIPNTECQRLIQIIEGTMVADWQWGTSAGVPVVLSFWMNASVNGPYSISIRQPAPATVNAVSYISTVNYTGGWQYFSLPIPAPPAGTAWVTMNQEALGAIEVGFVLNGSSSSAATTQLNQWLTPTNATYLCSTTQTNLWGLSTTVNQSARFTGVQLEAGTVATPFEVRPRPIELRLCQRYCTVIRAPQAYTVIGNGQFWSSTQCYLTLNLPTTVRDATALTLTSSGWGVQTPSGLYPLSSLAIAGGTAGMDSLLVLGTVTIAGTINTPCFMSANNSTTATLQLTCEFTVTV